MDETLAALEQTYEEALHSHFLLQKRVLNTRIIGSPGQHDEAFRALREGAAIPEAAGLALANYRASH